MGLNADTVRLAFAGLGTLLVGVGGWLVTPALGLAAAGAMLYAVAVIGALRATS